MVFGKQVHYMETSKAKLSCYHSIDSRQIKNVCVKIKKIFKNVEKLFCDLSIEKKLLK